MDVRVTSSKSPLMSTLAGESTSIENWYSRWRVHFLSTLLTQFCPKSALMEYSKMHIKIDWLWRPVRHKLYTKFPYNYSIIVISLCVLCSKTYLSVSIDQIRSRYYINIKWRYRPTVNNNYNHMVYLNMYSSKLIYDHCIMITARI